MTTSNGSGNGKGTGSVNAPDQGIRIGKKVYRKGDAIPERYRSVLEQPSRPSDPALAHGGKSAPNYGRPVVPHVVTFSGMLSTLSRSYRNADEAIRHSVDNAHMMLNDPVVAGPLFARQRMTSLLNWSVESEDMADPRLKDVADGLTDILTRTPRFTEYRRSLSEAIWYGRSAVLHKYGLKTTGKGDRIVYIRDWTPVSGDKIVFRYDDGKGKFDPDGVGIRVSPAHVTKDYLAGRHEIEYYAEGSAVFFEGWERRRLALHKHMIRDGEYEDPMTAGQIHGIGLRHFLYWTWYQKQESLAQLMEIAERTGMGFTIYYYPTGNPEAQSEVEKIAREQSHTNVILIPHDATQPDSYRIEQIPPNNQGITVLIDLVENFFGDQVTRFILGQTLSSKPDATGLGSGVADLQHDTLRQIIKYDAVSLEETITREVVAPLRDWVYPKFRNWDFNFRISTESQIPEQELNAIERAWGMGASIKTSDLFSKIGLSTPGDDDDVLTNPAITIQNLQEKQMEMEMMMAQQQAMQPQEQPQEQQGEQPQEQPQPEQEPQGEQPPWADRPIANARDGKPDRYAAKDEHAEIAESILDSVATATTEPPSAEVGDLAESHPATSPSKTPVSPEPSSIKNLDEHLQGVIESASGAGADTAAHHSGVARSDRRVDKEWAEKMDPSALAEHMQASESHKAAYPQYHDEFDSLVHNQMTRHPATGKGEEPWEQLQLLGFTEKVNSNTKKVTGTKPKYKTIPYSFERDRNGNEYRDSKGEKSPYKKRTHAIGSLIRDDVRNLYDRAISGDATAAKIIRQRKWYSSMRTRLYSEFGSMGTLFADVLGATSPNTPVKDNFDNSVEAFRRAFRGDYDDLIPQWEERIDRYNEAESELKAHIQNAKLPLSKGGLGMTKDAITKTPEYKRLTKVLAENSLDNKLLPDELKPGKGLDLHRPTKEGGEPLFGMNSGGLIRALVNTWKVIKTADPDLETTGAAPKVITFSGNLAGRTYNPTIDVWAARYLQRLSGKKRIPSMAETGVRGTILPDYSTTGQYRFGQDAFTQATEAIKSDPVMSKHLGDMGPDDLQALVWFLEKNHWTENNWTSGHGEGGSFEQEADLAGIADRDKLKDIRSILNKQPAKDLPSMHGYISKGEFEPGSPAEEFASLKKLVGRGGEAHKALAGQPRTTTREPTLLYKEWEDMSEEDRPRTPKGKELERKDWISARLAGAYKDEDGEWKLHKSIDDANKDPRSIASKMKEIARQSHSIKQDQALAWMEENRSPLDRYLVGASIVRSGFPATEFDPEHGLMVHVAGDIRRHVYENSGPNDIIASKVLPSYGHFDGEDEQAFDGEFVVRSGFNPNTLADRVFGVADRSNQEAAFVARVVRAGGGYEKDVDQISPLEHSPGIEIHFSPSATQEEIREQAARIRQLAEDHGLYGYTASVMPHRSRSSMSGEMQPTTAIRMMHLPEFSGAENGKRLLSLSDAELAEENLNQMASIDRIATEVMALVGGKVAAAVPLWYEVDTRFSHEYEGSGNEDKLHGGDAGPDTEAVGDGWRGRSARERIQAAVRNNAEKAGVTERWIGRRNSGEVSDRYSRGAAAITLTPTSALRYSSDSMTVVETIAGEGSKLKSVFGSDRYSTASEPLSTDELHGMDAVFYPMHEFKEYLNFGHGDDPYKPEGHGPVWNFPLRGNALGDFEVHPNNPGDMKSHRQAFGDDVGLLGRYDPKQKVITINAKNLGGNKPVPKHVMGRLRSEFPEAEQVRVWSYHHTPTNRRKSIKTPGEPLTREPQLFDKYEDDGRLESMPVKRQGDNEGSDFRYSEGGDVQHEIHFGDQDIEHYFDIGHEEGHPWQFNLTDDDISVGELGQTHPMAFGDSSPHFKGHYDPERQVVSVAPGMTAWNDMKKKKFGGELKFLLQDKFPDAKQFRTWGLNEPDFDRHQHPFPNGENPIHGQYSADANAKDSDRPQRYEDTSEDHMLAIHEHGDGVFESPEKHRLLVTSMRNAGLHNHANLLEQNVPDKRTLAYGDQTIPNPLREHVDTALGYDPSEKSAYREASDAYRGIVDSAIGTLYRDAKLSRKSETDEPERYDELGELDRLHGFPTVYLPHTPEGQIGYQNVGHHKDAHAYAFSPSSGFKIGKGGTHGQLFGRADFPVKGRYDPKTKTASVALNGPRSIPPQVISELIAKFGRDNIQQLRVFSEYEYPTPGWQNIPYPVDHSDDLEFESGLDPHSTGLIVDNNKPQAPDRYDEEVAATEGTPTPTDNPAPSGIEEKLETPTEEPVTPDDKVKVTAASEPVDAGIASPPPLPPRDDSNVSGPAPPPYTQWVDAHNRPATPPPLPGTTPPPSDAGGQGYYGSMQHDIAKEIEGRGYSITSERMKAIDQIANKPLDSHLEELDRMFPRRGRPEIETSGGSDFWKDESGGEIDADKVVRMFGGPESTFGKLPPDLHDEFLEGAAMNLGFTPESSDPGERKQEILRHLSNSYNALDGIVNSASSFGFEPSEDKTLAENAHGAASSLLGAASSAGWKEDMSKPAKDRIADALEFLHEKTPEKDSGTSDLLNRVRDSFGVDMNWKQIAALIVGGIAVVGLYKTLMS